MSEREKELEQQLQAKEEEIEQLKLENTQLKYKLKDLEETRVKLQLRLNDESRKEFSKYLQTKLQQAKEGLEFYENKDNYSFQVTDESGVAHLICCEDAEEKAQETLEIINKE